MKNKTKRRPLTEKERECAERAKRLFNKSGMNQTQLGEALGGINQSAVAQYLNAVIPMNIPVKIGLALALNASINEIDPDLKLPSALASDEEALLRAYRKADDRGKAITLGVAEKSAEYDSTPAPE